MKQNRKLDCLSEIRTRILTMGIAPGAALDESALSEEFGVSRTPLREVLQRLAGEGYVALADNRGAKVASMDLSTMRTFFQTAPLIYSTVARLAAENRTTQQLDELKSVQIDFKDALAGARPNDMSLCNHRFHELIGEMAANDYIMPSLRRLLIDHTRVSQMFYRPAAPVETVAIKKAADQHDAMITAIAAHEVAVAVDLTLQHWDLTRERIERFVRPDPLPMDVISLSEKRNAV